MRGFAAFGGPFSLSIIFGGEGGVPNLVASYIECSLGSKLGRCPGTVRRVFPLLVFQVSKQQNRTRTTSSTKRFPLEEL